MQHLSPGLGGQAVYDTDLNITWLANANLAASNSFGTVGIAFDGSMNLDTANTWIANMNVWNNGVGYLGFNDWRLPSMLFPDTSCTQDAAGAVPSTAPNTFNCSGGELGHLYYAELGGIAFQTGMNMANLGLDSGNPNVAMFVNIQGSPDNAKRYWSDTAYPLDPRAVFDFSFQNGAQNVVGPQFGLYAWAVRTGDVSVVPVPSAVWLFVSGLLGLIGVARREIS